LKKLKNRKKEDLSIGTHNLKNQLKRRRKIRSSKKQQIKMKRLKIKRKKVKRRVRKKVEKTNPIHQLMI